MVNDIALDLNLINVDFEISRIMSHGIIKDDIWQIFSELALVSLPTIEIEDSDNNLLSALLPIKIGFHPANNLFKYFDGTDCIKNNVSQMHRELALDSNHSLEPQVIARKVLEHNKSNLQIVCLKLSGAKLVENWDAIAGESDNNRQKYYILELAGVYYRLCSEYQRFESDEDSWQSVLNTVSINIKQQYIFTSIFTKVSIINIHSLFERSATKLVRCDEINQIIQLFEEYGTIPLMNYIKILAFIESINKSTEHNSNAIDIKDGVYELKNMLLKNLYDSYVAFLANANQISIDNTRQIHPEIEVSQDKTKAKFEFSSDKKVLSFNADINLKLSEVHDGILKYLDKYNDFLKEVIVISEDKIFLDVENLTLPGINLILQSKEIILSNKVVIDLSGNNGHSTFNCVAKSGIEVSKSNKSAKSQHGISGEDGEPGVPGQSAGCIAIIGRIKNGENLTIKTVGGNGSDGQGGGIGQDGKSGIAGIGATKEDLLKQVKVANPCPAGYVEHPKEKGTAGGTGGNGGVGGLGGEGGYGGVIVINGEFYAAGDEQSITTKTIAGNKIGLEFGKGKNGKNGEHGRAGAGGEGGKIGWQLGINDPGWARVFIEKDIISGEYKHLDVVDTEFARIIPSSHVEWKSLAEVGNHARGAQGAINKASLESKLKQHQATKACQSKFITYMYSAASSSNLNAAVSCKPVFDNNKQHLNESKNSHQQNLSRLKSYEQEAHALLNTLQSELAGSSRKITQQTIQAQKNISQSGGQQSLTRKKLFEKAYSKKSSEKKSSLEFAQSKTKEFNCIAKNNTELSNKILNKAMCYDKSKLRKNNDKLYIVYDRLTISVSDIVEDKNKQDYLLASMYDDIDIVILRLDINSNSKPSSNAYHVIANHLNNFRSEGELTESGIKKFIRSMHYHLPIAYVKQQLTDYLFSHFLQLESPGIAGLLHNNSTAIEKFKTDLQRYFNVIMQPIIKQNNDVWENEIANILVHLKSLTQESPEHASYFQQAAKFFSHLSFAQNNENPINSLVGVYGRLDYCKQIMTEYDIKPESDSTFDPKTILNAFCNDHSKFLSNIDSSIKHLKMTVEILHVFVQQKVYKIDEYTKLDVALREIAKRLSLSTAMTQSQYIYCVKLLTDSKHALIVASGVKIEHIKSDLAIAGQYLDPANVIRIEQLLSFTEYNQLFLPLVALTRIYSEINKYLHGFDLLDAPYVYKYKQSNPDIILTSERYLKSINNYLDNLDNIEIHIEFLPRYLDEPCNVNMLKIIALISSNLDRLNTSSCLISLLDKIYLLCRANWSDKVKPIWFDFLLKIVFKLEKSMLQECIEAEEHKLILKFISSTIDDFIKVTSYVALRTMIDEFKKIKQQLDDNSLLPQMDDTITNEHNQDDLCSVGNNTAVPTENNLSVDYIFKSSTEYIIYKQLYALVGQDVTDEKKRFMCDLPAHEQSSYLIDNVLQSIFDQLLIISNLDYDSAFANDLDRDLYDNIAKLTGNTEEYFSAIEESLNANQSNLKTKCEDLKSLRNCYLKLFVINSKNFGLADLAKLLSLVIYKYDEKLNENKLSYTLALLTHIVESDISTHNQLADVIVESDYANLNNQLLFYLVMKLCVKIKLSSNLNLEITYYSKQVQNKLSSIFASGNGLSIVELMRKKLDDEIKFADKPKFFTDSDLDALLDSLSSLSNAELLAIDLLDLELIPIVNWQEYLTKHVVTSSSYSNHINKPQSTDPDNYCNIDTGFSISSFNTTEVSNTYKEWLIERTKQIIALYNSNARLALSEPVTIQTTDEDAVTIDFNAPISNWSEEQVSAWIQLFINKHRALNLKDYLIELSAVIMHAVKLTGLAGKFEGENNIPRRTQILSYYCFLDAALNKNGRLGEIPTGEGKTVVAAMFAASVALLGDTDLIDSTYVNVITSNKVLAIRDAEITRRFYNLLNLTVDNNCDEAAQRDTDVLKKRYLNNIVYGDIGSIQRDLLQTEVLNNEIILDARSDATIIVDEVDSMLLDKGNETLYLSHDIPDFRYLRPLFFTIWAEVVKTDNHVNEVNKTNQVSEIHKVIKRLISSHQIIIPSCFAEFTEYKIPIWINSAITAKYLQKDVHYKIGKSHTNAVESEVIIMDLDTGVEQISTHWSNGVHQFLAIKETQKFRYETLKSVYISNLSYFKRHKGRVFGLTGTLGSDSELILCRKIYQLDYFVMPRHSARIFSQEEPTVKNSHKDWLSAIRAEIVTKSVKQAILVICESIEAAKIINDALVHSQQDKPLGGNSSKQRIFHYSSAFDKFEIGTQDNELKIGDIIIATNLAGRGTNLSLERDLASKHGLHVVLTYLPQNKRVEEQAFGRSARRCEPGSGRYIIHHDTINNFSRLIKLRDIEALLYVENFRRTTLPAIELEEQLSTQFGKTIKSFKENLKKDDLSSSDEYIALHLKALQDRWAVWLDIHQDDIQSSFPLADDNLLLEYKFFEKQCLLESKQNPSYRLVALPHELISLAKYYVSKQKYSDALACILKIIKTEPDFSAIAYMYLAYVITIEETRALDILKSIIPNYQKNIDVLLRKRYFKYCLRQSKRLLSLQLKQDVMACSALLQQTSTQLLNRGFGQNTNLTHSQLENEQKIYYAIIHSINKQLGIGVTLSTINDRLGNEFGPELLDILIEGPEQLENQVNLIELKNEIERKCYDTLVEIKKQSAKEQTTTEQINQRVLHYNKCFNNWLVNGAGKTLNDKVNLNSRKEVIASLDKMNIAILNSIRVLDTVNFYSSINAIATRQQLFSHHVSWHVQASKTSSKKLNGWLKPYRISKKIMVNGGVGHRKICIRERFSEKTLQISFPGVFQGLIPSLADKLYDRVNHRHDSDSNAQLQQPDLKLSYDFHSIIPSDLFLPKSTPKSGEIDYVVCTRDELFLFMLSNRLLSLSETFYRLHTEKLSNMDLNNIDISLCNRSLYDARDKIPWRSEIAEELKSELLTNLIDRHVIERLSVAKCQLDGADIRPTDYQRYLKELYAKTHNQFITGIVAHYFNSVSNSTESMPLRVIMQDIVFPNDEKTVLQIFRDLLISSGIVKLPCFNTRYLSHTTFTQIKNNEHRLVSCLKQLQDKFIVRYFVKHYERNTASGLVNCDPQSSVDEEPSTKSTIGIAKHKQTGFKASLNATRNILFGSDPLEEDMVSIHILPLANNSSAMLIALLRESIPATSTTNDFNAKLSSLRQMFLQNKLPVEIDEYTKYHMGDLVELVPSVERWNWHAFSLAMLGLSELGLGLALEFFTAWTIAGAYAGAVLIQEGANDMYYAARVGLQGNFNWSNYFNNKMVSLGVSAFAGLFTAGRALKATGDVLVATGANLNTVVKSALIYSGKRVGVESLKIAGGFAADNIVTQVNKTLPHELKLQFSSKLSDYFQNDEKLKAKQSTTIQHINAISKHCGINGANALIACFIKEIVEKSFSDSFLSKVEERILAIAAEIPATLIMRSNINYASALSVLCSIVASSVTSGVKFNALLSSVISAFDMLNDRLKNYLSERSKNTTNTHKDNSALNTTDSEQINISADKIIIDYKQKLFDLIFSRFAAEIVSPQIAQSITRAVSHVSNKIYKLGTQDSLNDISDKPDDILRTESANHKANSDHYHGRDGSQQHTGDTNHQYRHPGKIDSDVIEKIILRRLRDRNFSSASMYSHSHVTAYDSCGRVVDNNNTHLHGVGDKRLHSLHHHQSRHNHNRGTIDASTDIKLQSFEQIATLQITEVFNKLVDSTRATIELLPPSIKLLIRNHAIITAKDLAVLVLRSSIDNYYATKRHRLAEWHQKILKQAIVKHRQHLQILKQIIVDYIHTLVCIAYETAMITEQVKRISETSSDVSLPEISKADILDSSNSIAAECFTFDSLPERRRILVDSLNRISPHSQILDAAVIGLDRFWVLYQQISRSLDMAFEFNANNFFNSLTPDTAISIDSFLITCLGSNYTRGDALLVNNKLTPETYLLYSTLGTLETMFKVTSDQNKVLVNKALELAQSVQEERKNNLAEINNLFDQNKEAIGKAQANAMEFIRHHTSEIKKIIDAIRADSNEVDNKIKELDTSFSQRVKELDSDKLSAAELSRSATYTHYKNRGDKLEKRVDKLITLYNEILNKIESLAKSLADPFTQSNTALKEYGLKLGQMYAAVTKEFLKTGMEINQQNQGVLSQIIDKIPNANTNSSAENPGQESAAAEPKQKEDRYTCEYRVKVDYGVMTKHKDLLRTSEHFKQGRKSGKDHTPINGRAAVEPFEYDSEANLSFWSKSPLKVHEVVTSENRTMKWCKVKKARGVNSQKFAILADNLEPFENQAETNQATVTAVTPPAPGK